uniref:Basement membrane proteoglycan n=1 Tax=Trichuris muris TaxID=70415 RepID=A0A5S6QFK1_TRIMR
MCIVFLLGKALILQLLLLSCGESTVYPYSSVSTDNQLPDVTFVGAGENGNDRNSPEFIEVFPSQQTVKQGGDVVFSCRPHNIAHRIRMHWQRLGGMLPPKAIIQDGQLLIPNVMPEDAGVYVCKASSYFIPKEAEGRLDVEGENGNNGGVREQTGPSRCLDGEATCQNGECVKREYVCDGQRDCRDGSDEFNCPAPQACEPNEFQCNNRNCVQKMWLCDGDDDCGDGTDEQNCGVRQPGEACAPYEFQCKTQMQCVPASFQCDGQNDCVDGSDEIGCTPPVCVEPPQREITVQCGNTVMMSCRAVGVPVPYINWRLNWGPTCGPPRCTQSTFQGLGKLTIRNASEIDQGAYTCEAINSKGRILATPDAILTVTCHGVGGLCSSAGAIGPDRRTGGCQCKHFATGPNCDQCTPDAFHLSPRNPHGCIQCFCSGVTKNCRSTSWHRTQERLTFMSDPQGIALCDFSEKRKEASPRVAMQPYGYVTSTERYPDIMYWCLPSRMLGNKLTAYGGSLKFKLRFQCSGPTFKQPLVVLKGNEITLVARATTPLYPNQDNSVSIDIFETSFQREDGQPSTREHLLMTLANLDALMIRASHCSGQTETSLGDVSLDIAVDRDTQQEVAYEVEQCQCPPGYQGLSCEECAPGYERSGGGLYLGLCEPVTGRPTFAPPPSVNCNPDGSLTSLLDPRTRQCQCKSLATGQLCNQCAPGSFHLSQHNPNGCIKCFCFGVSQDCDSSNLYRATVTLVSQISDFTAERLEVKTADLRSPYTAPSGFTLESPDTLTYDRFYGTPAGRALYLELPREFLGNKVTSYGGYLRIKFNYKGYGADDYSPLVILRGNDVSLVHDIRAPVAPDQDHELSVPFYENHWKQEDMQAPSREQLMKVLADISNIMVKISFKEQMDSIRINEITMDYAVDRPGRQRALEVEQCRCPPEYIGTSCEECAPGYTKIPYLGVCQRCSCHGHSDRCDSKTGICFDCQHNTDGDQCERCLPDFVGDARQGTPYDCTYRATQRPCLCYNHSPRGCDSYGRCLRCEHNTEGTNCERCKAGFYGDATAGTPFDCKPCPCPGARECFVDSDGHFTCRGCPAGFTGRMCQECAPGYAKDPSEPRRCKPIGALRVVVQPPKRVQIEEGTTAVFRCSVEGDESEPYSLTWSRVDHPKLPVNSIDRAGVLTLYSSSVADSGTYQCTATTQTQEAKDLAELEVVRRVHGQRPTARVEPQQQVVRQGEPFQIRCSAEGSPQPELSWEREDGTLPPEVELFDGVMVIRQTMKHHEGTYYCVAKNPVGKDRAPCRVIVEEGGQRPQVRVDPPELQRRVGETAQFRCYAGDSRDITYEWTSPTGPLRPGMEHTDGILLIRSCTQNDAGVYQCLARNRFGEDTGQVKLIVEAGGDGPKPLATPSVQTVKVGESAEFNCYSPGDPPVLVTWGSSIPAGPLRPGILQEHGRIYISSARKSDEGTYYCTASNQFGTESVPVTLYVEEGGLSPTVQIKPTDRWEGQLGEQFEFQCVSTGSPEPQVTWIRQDESPMGDYVQELPRGKLRFQHLEESDVGEYVCSATNIHGTASATATVGISERLTVKVIPNVPELELFEGQPLSLECVAEGTPKPTIEWIFDMGPSRGDVPEGYKPAKIEGRFIRHDSVSPANEGTYKCRASNQFQTREAAVKVKVVSRPKRQVVIVGGSERLVELGDDLEMSCILPNPTDKDILWWTRVDGNLTERHEEASVGVLRIVGFQSEDAGEYECQSYDMKTNQKVSSGRIKLVEAGSDPSLNVLYVDGPEIKVVKAGVNMQLDCTTMTDKYDVQSELKWFFLKNDQKEVETRGDVDDGILTIRNMTLADSGTYKCVRFIDGERDGEFQNVVLVSNRDSDPVEVAGRAGADLELHCPLYIVSGMSILWSKKDGVTPEDAMVEADVLVIPDFQKHKEGIYHCEATVGSAVAVGAVRPTVAEANAVQLLIDVQPEYVRIGEQVTFRCLVDGDPDANVRWEKRGGQLPTSATVFANTLTLRNVVDEDGGIYRCVASTKAGIMTTDAVLHVGTRDLHKAPNGRLHREEKIEVAIIGLAKRLTCPGRPSKTTSGTITWSRAGDQIPAEYLQHGGVLLIPKFKESDAGLYTCIVRTTNGYTVAFNITVLAEELVPKFADDAYVRLPRLPRNAYRAFDVQVAFKPTKQNGLMFYTEKEEGEDEGDFFAFGLEEGKLVLRFDLGDGVTELASSHSLALNKWHKIFVKREFNKGLISIVGEQQRQRYSNGIETGLGIGDHVYIGGVPDFSSISPNSGFKRGFSGIISSIQISGMPVNIGESHTEIRGVEQTDSCLVNACLNDAKCFPAPADFGYKCECKPKFVGTYCERKIQCNGVACESGGICARMDSRFGPCLCPANRTGTYCEKDSYVRGTPRFSSGSFVVLPKAENMARNLQISLSIKPLKVHDAVLFYAANDLVGTGDYVGLVISEKSIELRYDNGLGSYRGQSSVQLQKNEWYDIKVERRGRIFTVIVNGIPTFLETYDDDGGLSLFTDVFIGGVYPDMYTAAGFGIKRSFTGCMEDTVFINDQKYRLIADSISSGNITSCQIDNEDELCETRPDGTVACTCPPGFTGKRCEIRLPTDCAENLCGPHGECLSLNDDYRCRCFVGYTGDHCEHIAPVDQHAYFNGDSYIEFPRAILPHTSSEDIEQIELKLKTTKSDGLILWHGRYPKSFGSDSDYLSLSVVDGFLEFSYELGGGPLHIVSSSTVNDGLEHLVKLTRKGRHGEMELDDLEPESGMSDGILAILNAEGNLFLGGVPNAPVATDGRFNQNFVGCISDVKFDGNPVNFLEDSLGGYDVVPCGNQVLR